MKFEQVDRFVPLSSFLWHFKSLEMNPPENKNPHFISNSIFLWGSHFMLKIPWSDGQLHINYISPMMIYIHEVLPKFGGNLNRLKNLLPLTFHTSLEIIPQGNKIPVFMTTKLDLNLHNRQCDFFYFCFTVHNIRLTH